VKAGDFARSVLDACNRVGATMAAVSDHHLGIHVVFFLRIDCGADKEHTVLENIESFRRWCDRARPAGVRQNIILRYVSYDALLACKSVQAMAGPGEALRQVFGLEATGDWAP